MLVVLRPEAEEELLEAQAWYGMVAKENEYGSKKYDLSLVRRHRPGRREILCRNVPGQRGRNGLSRARRLSRWQARRYLDGRVHRDRHPLPRPEWWPRVQAQRGFFVSGCD